jgi:hypothetical protein
MEILKLPAGQIASSDSDCIRIQQLDNGRFALEGSVLLSCGDGEAVESVSLVGGETYDSYAAAEAAGVAWASEHCPEVLYISCSAGTLPLPDIG